MILNWNFIIPILPLLKVFIIYETIHSGTYFTFFNLQFLLGNLLRNVQLWTKKTPHLLELFLPWSYLCEFLRLRRKIGIIGEKRSWTLLWCVWFVLILIHLKDMVVFLKMVLYVHNQDQYTSSCDISKIFCLCKISVIKIILQNFLQKIRVVIVAFWCSQCRLVFYSCNIHPTKKKVATHKYFFFIWSYLCHFLSLSGKSCIIGKLIF